MKLSVGAARDLALLSQCNDLASLIVVVGVGCTPYGSKELVDNCRCPHQVFRCSELVLTLVDHELNPDHRVLSAAEKAKYIKKNMIQRELSMPCIFTHDPFAKYYDFTDGQFVEFTYDFGGEIGTQSHVKRVMKMMA